MSDGINVIGDVHGCIETLKALIKQLPDDAQICFTGDLIDRGPRSKEVVQLIIDGGYDCVKGNHEQFMIDNEPHWLTPNNGGTRTKWSYLDNGELDQETFNDHRKWMMDLPVYIEYEDIDLVVSHSVIHDVWHQRNSDDPVDKEMFRDHVLWTRDFKDLVDIGLYNIVGHTPQTDGPKIENNYSIIDTGAAFGYNLTCMHYPSMKIYTQENLDIEEIV